MPRATGPTSIVLALCTSLLGAGALAAGPRDWTRQTTGPIALLELHHGDGGWIARGASVSPLGGGVLISSVHLYFSADLQSWEKVLDLGDPHAGNWVELMDFAYGGGLWMAVGSRGSRGFTASSPDGRNWTVNGPSFPKESLSRILHANGTWVALPYGVNTGLWTSLDGRIWTAHPFDAGGQPAGWTHPAAYGNGTWLIPEQYTHPSLGRHLRMWHSSDARTWTSSEPEPPFPVNGEAAEVQALEYANGLWLMARHDAGADLWASPNGRHWTPVFRGLWVDDLCYGNGVWVAKSDRTLLTSTDARTWNIYSMPASPLYDIHFAEGTLLASGTEISPSGLSNVLYVSRAPGPSFATMSIGKRTDGNGLAVSCLGPQDHAYRLQRSADLRNWTDIATAHRNLAAYPVPAPPVQGFYRTLVSTLTDGDDWKNQISAAGFVEAVGEPFLSTPSPGQSEEQPRWIKFALPLEEPGRVYFQHSAKYPFHYEFARARLPRFAEISLREFEAVSLFRERQQIVLGALIFSPNPLVAEIGIQLVGADAYPPEQVAQWFHSVRSRVVIPGVTFHYLPTFEQTANAADHARELAALGVPVDSLDRWVANDQCYSRGWALGRLVYLPTGEIPAAFTDGRLRASDILLTDVVPAELPPVAGILSLSPAAPNSHVVILAQSSEVPFGYIASPALRTRVLGWKGEEILLQIYPTAHGGVVKAVKAQEHLGADLRQRLLGLKQLPALDVVRKASVGRIAVPVAGLVPADIQHVGGKAANFGVLARAIPENAPAGAIAFTFDLWDAFLDEKRGAGGTLRQAMAEKLAAFAGVPADLAGLRQALATVRQAIERDADFSEDQRRAILDALAGFDPRRNLRFRSSTNVEDSEAFTGAGLYDSYSGCPADDLDEDNLGPSHCDPTENNERGVFRALRKVYASFYNENAFLERRRRGVREEDVGMAVLVHLSAPDEIEWANGVATLRVKQAQDPATRSVSARLVTQAGAVSVAQPESQARPEVVTVEWSGRGNPAWTVEQPSGLVRLGDRVLEWPKDYDALLGLLDTAARAYATLLPARQELTLDFEYKKLDPGRLSVKQIREIPSPTQTAPLLIPDAGEVVVLQYSAPIGGDLDHPVTDIWANHRLKSSWRFLPSPLAPGLMTEVTLRDGDGIRTLSGPMDGFPEARMSVVQNRVQYAFVHGEGSSRRTVRFNLVFPWGLEKTTPPFVLLSDAVMDLQVDYDTPQPSFDWQGALGSRTKDIALLEPKAALEVGVTPCTLRLTQGSLTIESEVDWWSLHRDAYRGDWYTTPLAGFRETRLVGLASQAIVLRSDFAQSSFSTHHNWGVSFLFEPGMEPGMAPQILAELRAANIKAVLLTVGTLGLGRPFEGLIDVSTRCEVKTLGYDGALRAR